MTRKSVRFAADVMERADMRMVQGSNGASLALKAFAQVGEGRDRRRQNLTATVRSAACRAPYTLPHPARTNRAVILVGAEPSAGAQVMARDLRRPILDGKNPIVVEKPEGLYGVSVKIASCVRPEPARRVDRQLVAFFNTSRCCREFSRSVNSWVTDPTLRIRGDNLFCPRAEWRRRRGETSARVTTGTKYDYVCAECGTAVGGKTDNDASEFHRNCAAGRCPQPPLVRAGIKRVRVRPAMPTRMSALAAHMRSSHGLPSGSTIRLRVIRSLSLGGVNGETEADVSSIAWWL